MKFRRVTLLAIVLLSLGPISSSQGNPKLENATTAVTRAFESHDIVMFGEIHGNKQEYEWLRTLVANPEFADRVDDIVMDILRDSVILHLDSSSLNDRGSCGQPGC